MTEAPRRAVWILFGLWAAIWVWSLIFLAITEPSGDGFTRGLNRVAGFLGWQGVAAALAVAVWIMGRGLAGGARWATRLPLILALLLVLGIAGMIGVALLGSSPPTPPATGVALG